MEFICSFKPEISGIVQSKIHAKLSILFSTISYLQTTDFRNTPTGSFLISKRMEAWTIFSEQNYDIVKRQVHNEVILKYLLILY